MKRIILLAFLSILISLNSFSSNAFNIQKPSKEWLKYDPKIGISIMPIRYNWNILATPKNTPNFNTEFQINKSFAINIGIAHRYPKKKGFSYDEIGGTKFNFGTTLNYPIMQKISIQFQINYLYAMIDNYTNTFRGDTIIKFNTNGFSFGAGFEYRPVKNIFLRLIFCTQDLPFKYVKGIEYPWIRPMGGPTSGYFHGFAQLGGTYDLQFSVGYRFGWKKK